jgi:tol-pal system protein YbgF
MQRLTLLNDSIRGRLLRAAICAGLLLPVAARAALFEDEDARKAILDLRAKSNEQARQNEALTRQLTELSTKIEQRIEPAMRGLLELQNQIELLRQEVAKLRGQLEVQTNELSQTQRKELDMFANLDARIKKFEPSAVQIDGKTVSVDPSEKRSYDAALAQFRGGDFRGAQAGFQQLLLQNPDGAYAPNAMFWLGSSQFALKDYRSAMATHQAFLAKFSEHPRAPDAMLNLAYAQIESGDKKTARKTLESVAEKYADSPAAQAAKDRLASLR